MSSAIYQLCHARLPCRVAVACTASAAPAAPSYEQLEPPATQASAYQGMDRIRQVL